MSLSPLRRLTSTSKRCTGTNNSKSLHPFDRHAQRVIVAQIVELGGVFPLDRRDTQHLSLAVAFRLFARAAGKRGELLLSHEMQIVVVLMDAGAIAVETASHRAQKRLHFESHTMFEQRPHPRFKSGRIPRRSRRAADVRVGYLPFRVRRQQRTQPR